VEPGNAQRPTVRIDDDQLAYIFNGLAGMMAAGALFSMLACCEALFVFGVWKYSYPPDLANIFLWGIFGSIFAVTIGSVVMSVTGIISIVLVWIINKSLGCPMSHRTAALSTGSLAGFLPTAYLVFTPWSIWVTLLAMAMGAYGASWSARGHKLDAWRPQSHETKYQLSIFRLMIGTAWIAGILATINFTGYATLAIGIGAWFALNALLVGFAKLYRVVRPASP